MNHPLTRANAQRPSGAPLVWERYYPFSGKPAERTSLGRLGYLVVRQVGPEPTTFEVAVFGVALKERSADMVHGKERAVLAAKRWIAAAVAILGEE